MGSLIVLVFLFGLLTGILIGMVMSMLKYNSMMRRGTIVPGKRME